MANVLLDQGACIAVNAICSDILFSNAVNANCQKNKAQPKRY